MCTPQALSQPSLPGWHVSVLCASNTASHSWFLHTPELCFSVVRANSGALVFSLVSYALPSSRYQSGSSERSRALVFSQVMRVLPSSRFQSSSSVRSGAPVFSLDMPAPKLSVLVQFQVSALELQFSVWSHAFPGSPSQSALSRVPVCESAHSPVQVATASWCPSRSAPSPFHLSSDICAWIHGSLFGTSIFIAGDIRL